MLGISFRKVNSGLHVKFGSPASKTGHQGSGHWTSIVRTSAKPGVQKYGRIEAI